MDTSSTSLRSYLTSPIYGTLRDFIQTPITLDRFLFLQSSSISFTTSPPTTTTTITIAFNCTVTSSLKALTITTNSIVTVHNSAVHYTPRVTNQPPLTLSGGGFTRVKAASAAPFTSIDNLLGFKNQFGNSQIHWFQFTSDAMHKYSKYFNNSVPLSSIVSSGFGAVAVRGVPSVNEANRNFLYPTDAEMEPFATSRFHPRRQLPNAMSVTFQHCEYHGLEDEAEVTGLVTHTNLRWSIGNGDQNEWTRINSDVSHQGEVWSLMCHRFSKPVSFNIQFAQVIAAHYHHDEDTNPAAE